MLSSFNAIFVFQVKEVAEIKKDPTVALTKIKEVEEREKQHGATERSTKRKEELKVFHAHKNMGSAPVS